MTEDRILRYDLQTLHDICLSLKTEVEASLKDKLLKLKLSSFMQSLNLHLTMAIKRSRAREREEFLLNLMRDEHAMKVVSYYMDRKVPPEPEKKPELSWFMPDFEWISRQLNSDAEAEVGSMGHLTNGGEVGFDHLKKVLRPPKTGRDEFSHVRNDVLARVKVCKTKLNTLIGNMQIQEPNRKERSPALTDDVVLLLSLLSLSPDQRDAFILNEAKKRGLVEPLARAKGEYVVKEGYLRAIENLKPLVEVEKKQKSSSPAVLERGSKAQNEKLSKREKKALKNAESTVKVPEVAPKAGREKDEKDKYSYEEQVTMLVNELDDLSDPRKIVYQLNVGKKNTITDEARTQGVQMLTKMLVERKKGHLHTGEVRINARNYQEGYVTDVEGQDVFISNPVIRRFALHGDLVEIYVHHSTQTSPGTSSQEEDQKPRKLGFVTRIIEKRHNRKTVGVFEPFNTSVRSRQYAMFYPRDPKMPTLKVPIQNWPNALLVPNPRNIDKVLYEAEVIKFKKSKPIGNIIRTFGQCGELQAEVQAILASNSLNLDPFPEAVEAQYAEMEFEISEEELKKREDLRKMCIFTIDPSTARDLDDALSVRELENGHYEVGVHISDVSYFLEEASVLDEIVKKRATSVYMVDSVHHMLPKPLCFLCSLLPGEDKLSFSVFWEITAQGEILKTRFTRSVLNSCAQLSYDDAQKVIEEPSKDFSAEFPAIYGGHSFQDIQKAIKILYLISQSIRGKRVKNGALKIDQPKLSFELDPETRKPLKFAVYELKEANRMIEDFMILANCSVAEFIYKKFPETSILRAHQKPNEGSLDSLQSTLKKFGLNLDGRDSTKLRDSMERLIREAESPVAAGAVLNVMLSKPMQRAKYFCSAFVESPRDLYHFALAIPIYTHFTSPIRRYPDILVHRALSAALGYSEETNREPAELQQIATVCNDQKWSAKLAGDECSDLYFRHLVQKSGSLVTQAGVIAIGVFSMEVILVNTGHNVKIWYKCLKAPTTVTAVDDPKINEVVVNFGKKKKLKVRLFSLLKVVVSVQKNKLVISEILDPKA